MTGVSPERARGEYERVFAWLREVAARRASARVEVPGGLGVLNERFPAAHDHDFVLLWTPVNAK